MSAVTDVTALLRRLGSNALRAVNPLSSEDETYSSDYSFEDELSSNKALRNGSFTNGQAGADSNKDTCKNVKHNAAVEKELVAVQTALVVSEANMVELQRVAEQELAAAQAALEKALASAGELTAAEHVAAAAETALKDAEAVIVGMASSNATLEDKLAQAEAALTKADERCSQLSDCAATAETGRVHAEAALKKSEAVSYDTCVGKMIAEERFSKARDDLDRAEAKADDMWRDKLAAEKRLAQAHEDLETAEVELHGIRAGCEQAQTHAAILLGEIRTKDRLLNRARLEISRVEAEFENIQCEKFALQEQVDIFHKHVVDACQQQVETLQLQMNCTACAQLAAEKQQAARLHDLRADALRARSQARSDCTPAASEPDRLKHQLGILHTKLKALHQAWTPLNPKESTETLHH